MTDDGGKLYCKDHERWMELWLTLKQKEESFPETVAAEIVKYMEKYTQKKYDKTRTDLALFGLIVAIASNLDKIVSGLYHLLGGKP